MSTWSLGQNILETVRDRDLVPKDHEWEMAYGMSNGQVLDDVACAGLLIRNWLHMETPETINKNSKYNSKTAVYHNVNGDPALLHISKKAGYKVIG